MRARTLRIKSVNPPFGIEGGKVSIEGTGFDPEESSSTQILFGDAAARLLLMSSTRILTQVPDDAKSGPLTVQLKNKTSNSFDFQVGQKLANDLNPVDNPIFDSEGNLYVTFSGKRGETVPVSVYKITAQGEVKPYLSNIPNATSLALDPEGNLFVSSRFEGTIYKATPKADVTVFAKDLGVPTGIAFNKEGFLFVGDRGGRILKISPEGESTVFAEIPESMVAFHLALDSEGNLLVSNPALSSHNQILMIDRYGKVIPLYGGFGRPQGIAVDSAGNIYVCEAKAGDSGILRISRNGEISTVISGPVMVGLALDGHGNAAVAAQNAVYKISLPRNGNH
jgi:sugar lactone lactonase YvrE